uniref:Ion transport domain-containing protein n=1 Tax=Neolamprologus brichardi TaxID=32507 RepID=A0A3Q4IBK2_NEOBR
VFKAVSQGNTADLHGLLDYLQLICSIPSDERNGKAALLKALLNLKDGRNDTIEVILDAAEKTEDLENLINASYTDPYYKEGGGDWWSCQTALHVAIERRSFEHVKLLVQKGADVQAKANGKFIQRTAEMGFYSGELPLSLAACTNQPDIVSFLMETPYRRADVTDRDSQGNTVLHTLVVIADNTKENTDVIAKMYDEILLQEIENTEGMTPLKLAAKLGKIENRPEMLQIEPLRSLLQNKWERFASKLFLMNFLLYVVYLTIFTAVALHRKDGKKSLVFAVCCRQHSLTCVIMYGCGQEEYVALLVLSLALAWVNLLYYLRGSKQLGMYGVMMQRMILRDLLHFLSVYCVLLFGFSAVKILIDSKSKNIRMCKIDLSYRDVRFTILEMFKFTIGMGELQFTDDLQYKEVYHILLISYIVLTYILLLNMLIALMSNTVERLSNQSENIWNLQRAFTILDMERSLPKPQRHKLLSRSSKICLPETAWTHRNFSGKKKITKHV